MATVVSRATGNWLTTATWALCDATSELDSETGSTAMTTSYVASSAFTPGAITVDAILVKLASRVASPSGTFSVQLYNSTGATPVATVTINAADLANYQTYNLGWYQFPISSTTLAAATNYQIRLTTSVAGEVTAYRDSTAGNWSRQLRTTTQQAPAAGDKIIVAGEHTGAGTGNSFTITMDATSTSTTYGSASFPQSLSINKRSMLKYGTAASTAYYLKIAGIIRIMPGGEFDIGVSGSAIPSTSSADLKFSVATNVDSGLIVGNGGTFKTYGNSLTYIKTKLAADVAGASTSATTTDSTGWKSGDVIVFPSTTRTNTQIETVTLNADASGTSLAWTGGITNAHGGNSSTGVQADLYNLNRNLRISGTDVTHCSYLYVDVDATVDMEWSELFWLGSGTANKRGLDVITTTGSFVLNGCTLRDFATSAFAAFIQGATGTGTVTVSNCCVYNIANPLQISSTINPNVTVSGNIVGKVASDGISVGTPIVSVSNNICTSNSTSGLALSGTGAYGTFSGNTSYANGSVGFNFSGTITGGTITSSTIWRNNNYGLYFASSGAFQNVLFSGGTLFGNASANVLMANACNACIFTNYTVNGGATLVAPVGFQLYSVFANLLIENSTLGVTSGHSTSDLAVTSGNSGYGQTAFLNNVTLASSTPVSSVTNLTRGSFIAGTKLGGTVGSNKVWYANGTQATDTTTFGSTAFSVRATPTGGSGSYLDTVIGRSAVANGGSVAVSIAVRKSAAGDGAAYNGANLALYVRRNYGAGITADTLLATSSASAGTWDTLNSGTVSSTDDTVLEFFVRCDGNAGWANCATFGCNAILNTKTLHYWLPGTVFAVNDNASTSGAFVFG